MNKPCPFCGDTRDASVEELAMKFDPPNMFFAACQCCGCQGPPAITRGAALVMWDERRTPGDAAGFCELADRLSGHASEDEPTRIQLNPNGTWNVLP